MRIIIVLCLLFVPAFIVYAEGTCKGDSEEIQFSSFDGSTHSYGDLVGQPETILMFWTSQCFYCRQEFKKLNQMTLEELNVPILFVNLGESVEAIGDFFKKMQINSGIQDKVIMDQKLFFVHNLGVLGVPTYIFFKDGQVVYQSYRLHPEEIKGIFKHE